MSNYCAIYNKIVVKKIPLLNIPVPVPWTENLITFIYPSADEARKHVASGCAYIILIWDEGNDKWEQYDDKSNNSSLNAGFRAELLNNFYNKNIVPPKPP